MPDRGDPLRGVEERFAEAVEPGRTFGLLADDDPDLARDLEIVGALCALGSGLSPSVDAKVRMRARVLGALAVDGPPSDGGGRAAARPPEPAPDVAVGAAPTEHLPVVAPSPDEAATPTLLTEPDLARTVRRRRRRHALPSRPAARPGPPRVARRVLTVGMAAMVAVAALAGGGVFASRDAVPGDPLYGIKRAAEAAGGIFAGGAASRGRHDLDLAATRLDEIERMARDGAADPAAFTAAFQDFQGATRAGTRLVLAGDDPDRSATDLSGWATQQTARLSALRATLPAAGPSDADDALRLLDRVHRRAVALMARSGCGQVTSGSDDLGPLPGDGPCTARQATPGGPGLSGESGPTDRARTAPGATAGQEAAPAAAQNGTQNEQRGQDGGSDPALLPGVQVGSGGQNGAAPTTTGTAPPSDGKKDVNVPLPLPIPITVPPLLPGKPGLLG